MIKDLSTGAYVLDNEEKQLQKIRERYMRFYSSQFLIYYRGDTKKYAVKQKFMSFINVKDYEREKCYRWVRKFFMIRTWDSLDAVNKFVSDEIEKMIVAKQWEWYRKRQEKHGTWQLVCQK